MTHKNIFKSLVLCFLTSFLTIAICAAACATCNGDKKCQTCWGSGTDSAGKVCYMCSGSKKCYVCGGTG